MSGAAQCWSVIGTVTLRANGCPTATVQCSAVQCSAETVTVQCSAVQCRVSDYALLLVTVQCIVLVVSNNNRSFSLYLKSIHSAML
jgi:hypothetical protein